MTDKDTPLWLTIATVLIFIGVAGVIGYGVYAAITNPDAALNMR